MNGEILTSPAGQLMLSYCPVYYAPSRVFKYYLQSSGMEIDEQKQGLKSILQSMFVNTAPDWALDIWEKELDLVSFAEKPLDQRRSRIISKIRGKGMVTVPLIKSVAESYVYGTVSVTEHPQQYSFTIKFLDSRGIPPNYADLQTAIEEIKPAHLEVVYEFLFTTWGEYTGWVKNWGNVKDQGMTWDIIRTWKPA